MANPLTLNAQERDTIIAALRLWQTQWAISMELVDIASDSGDRPLSDNEIDTLIEGKLNT